MQFVTLPVIVSIVQEFPSLHVVGQLLWGSQVSAVSIAPLPQLGEQLLSVLALQPGGQHASPLRQVVIA